MALDPKRRKTAEDFIAWAMEQEGRYELEAGEVIAMAPERMRNLVVKGRVFWAFTDALRNALSPYEALADGGTVRIDPGTVYEPDGMIALRADIDDDSVLAPAPILVFEVTSPSSSARDTHHKLVGYFAIPSLVHYLVIDPQGAPVVHHRRQDDGTILTRIVPSGALVLDPPCISVPIEPFFA